MPLHLDENEARTLLYGRFNQLAHTVDGLDPPDREEIENQLGRLMDIAAAIPYRKALGPPTHPTAKAPKPRRKGRR